MTKLSGEAEMKSGNYLQFPLCGLLFFNDAIVCLEHALAYTIVSYSKKAVTFEDYELVPHDYDNSDEHSRIVVACDRLGFVPHSCIDIIQKALTFENKVAAFQDRFGNDAWVRLKGEIFKRVWNDNSMSDREIRIVLAIYSKIGLKKYPVEITYEEIQIRAAGLRSRSLLRRYSEGFGNVELLSIKKVRITVQKLHHLNFFAKVSSSNRQYFQHLARFTDEQLAVAVINKISYFPMRRHTDQLNRRRIMEAQNENRKLPPGILSDK